MLKQCPVVQSQGTWKARTPVLRYLGAGYLRATGEANSGGVQPEIPRAFKSRFDTVDARLVQG